mgnify:CR=1 FL=1
MQELEELEMEMASGSTMRLPMFMLPECNNDICCWCCPCSLDLTGLLLVLRLPVPVLVLPPPVPVLLLLLDEEDELVPPPRCFNLGGMLFQSQPLSHTLRIEAGRDEFEHEMEMDGEGGK